MRANRDLLDRKYSHKREVGNAPQVCVARAAMWPATLWDKHCHEPVSMILHLLCKLACYAC